MDARKDLLSLTLANVDFLQHYEGEIYIKQKREKYRSLPLQNEKIIPF
jgi:hypothetical protein